MQKSYPVEPRSISSKILLFVLFASTYVVYNSYSAGLTSFLTVGKIPLAVSNLEDVFKLGYTVSTMKGTVYSDYFAQVKKTLPSKRF